MEGRFTFIATSRHGAQVLCFLHNLYHNTMYNVQTVPLRDMTSLANFVFILKII